MRLFLFIYSLFHVTPVDSAKTYDIQSDPNVSEPEKMFDSFIGQIGRSVPRWMVWLPIVTRWILSTFIVVSAYAVVSSNREALRGYLPPEELPFVKTLSFWFPIYGIAAPGLLWFLTLFWMTRISRHNLPLSNDQLETYLKYKMKRTLLILGFAAGAFIVFYLLD